MRNILLRFLAYPGPLRPFLAKNVIRRFSLFSYEKRMAIGALDRPYYGYCIYQAAALATALRYPRISVIEFGCGGGQGLMNAEMHIEETMKIFPVEIELYGFDIGSGLPQPQDYRDMPYYFKGGLYKMDQLSLERKLKRAKLVIGDIKDTCKTFFDKYKPAPIGCIFHDLDFYSSTIDAFAIFEESESYFLPRVFMYFDDIIGNNELWTCNEFTGERLAIHEFNAKHNLKKIAMNYYTLFKHRDEAWPTQIYIYHDFGHSRYNDFIAEKEQIEHEDRIALK